jgi:hypothetical protein
MKIGPGAIGTAENESGSAKNMKTGPDAIGAVENEFGRAKHENWTRRPLYRRKRVRARQT